MPMNQITIEIRMIRRGNGVVRERATELSYEVPPETVPAQGLNLTAAQRTKLGNRLQEMSLLLDENDSNL